MLIPLWPVLLNKATVENSSVAWQITGGEEIEAASMGKSWSDFYWKKSSWILNITVLLEFNNISIELIILFLGFSKNSKRKWI